MGDEMLTNLVRVGTVTAVDRGGRRARVVFDDMPSGWLYVLQHSGAVVDVKENGDPPHEHEAGVEVWMPAVNQTVLALYLPVDDGDGFILGAI